MNLLVKNGRVIDPETRTDETLDVLIYNGKIAEVKKNIPSAEKKVIDATGLIVAPGFIDMHTHLREPGQEHKETIKTGAAAAARGGFCSIACMPNTSPVNDNPRITRYILSEAAKNSKVNIFPIAAITLGEEGEKLVDMAGLIDAGALAFSDDGQPVQNSLMMREALKLSKNLNTLIIDHCEDKHLSGKGVMHEGLSSTTLNLKGIPASSEEVMVARDIILAKELDTKIHLAHISVEGSVDLLRWARDKKLKITAEVTPHHLLLTDKDIQKHDTNLKVNPPIRSKRDVLSLIYAVKEGLLDVFATDHAPHTQEEKGTDFNRAPFGINGLETAVSLLLDRFIGKKIISLSRFIEMISTTPAKILGLENKGNLYIGADGDLTILDMSKKVIIDTDDFQSKSINSPFKGWKLKGAPVMTVVAGEVVFPFNHK